jgi:hypothetical protein
MAVPLRPHLATVRPKDSGTTADGVRLSLSHEAGGAVSVRCQITQESPARAFERFGVELTEPWLLLSNAPGSPAAKESFLVQGARVDWTYRGVSRSFLIERTQLTDVGMAADNLAVLMKVIDTSEDPD